MIIICASALLVIPSVGVSQSTAENEEPAVSDAGESEFLESLAKWHAVRNPSSQHVLLSRLAGEWNVLIRFYGGDRVWETRGTARVDPIHGGRFVLEHMSGEVFAPNLDGEMQSEAFSATRLLGYDNYQNAYVGVLADNQNTHLLSFSGHALPGETVRELRLFGVSDEPMLEMHGAAMQYVLAFDSEDHYTWTTYAIAVGEGSKVLEFDYTRR